MSRLFFTLEKKRVILCPKGITDVKILFIGNSYTYYNDMPSLFSRLCGCNGKAAQVFSVTKGGRKLHENLDPADETTAELEAVLRENAMAICG